MKKILLTTSAIFLGISAFTQTAYADQDTNALILQKLEALQKQVAAQNTEIARLKANAGNHSSLGEGEDDIEEYLIEHEEGFHLSKIKVGGWADFVYEDNDIDGNDQVTSPDSFFLTFSSQLDEKWSFLGELGFEGGPFGAEEENKGEFRIERLYLQYEHSELLNARIGKFSTPVGLWVPEHWAFNVPSVNTPFFIDEEASLVPLYNIGVEGYGKYSFSSEGAWVPDIEYHAWVSGGDALDGSIKPGDDELAHGINVNATFNEMALIGLGVNRRSNPDQLGRRELSLVPHFELYLPQDITLAGEYVAQDRSEGFDDVEAWYASAKWDFQDNMYAYYRRDQGENGGQGLGQNEDSNTFTLGYSPKPFIRTKIEYSMHEFEATSVEDFNKFSAWIGVAF